MYIWYEYCLRAYNRYGGWDTAIAAEQWEAENKKEADVDEDQDPTHSVPIRLRSDSTSKHEIPSNLLKVQNQAQSGLFGGLFSMNSPATAAAKASTLDSGVGGNAPLKNHVEGYLNLLNTSGLKDTYDRYYFVMEYHNLWYFEEEESYVLYKSKSNKNDSNDPSNSPIISRPIDLSKYKAVQKDKYKKPNIITIEMKDNVSSIQLKTWIVQTDTDEETEMWMKGFQIACHSNF